MDEIAPARCDRPAAAIPSRRGIAGRTAASSRSAPPVRRDLRRAAACFVLAEDVGERERLEGQLRQAQRMEAIGRLAGGVAHDFNNLLTDVIGYSELCSSRRRRATRRRGDAEEIKKAGERAAGADAAAADASGAARRSSPSSRPQRDRRRARADAAAPDPLQHLDRDAARPDAGRVRPIRGQIEQVIVNLAVNAGDAMPDGGTTHDRDRRHRARPDYFRASSGRRRRAGSLRRARGGRHGRRDGRGDVSHIFEPFYTTKGSEHGTGLGLATVYGIVTPERRLRVGLLEPGRGTTLQGLPARRRSRGDRRSPARRAAPLTARTHASCWSRTTSRPRRRAPDARRRTVRDRSRPRRAKRRSRSAKREPPARSACSSPTRSSPAPAASSSPTASVCDTRRCAR